MRKIILDLCGGTGAWSKPYQNNPEYKVYVMTLPDVDVCDTRTFPSEVSYAIQEGQIYGILAAPPCTMFSIARNDTTAKEKRDLEKGMKTIQACLNIIWWSQYKKYRTGQGLKFWALENPASGYLKKFLGTPPFIFDPSEYGDEHTKKTAVWGMFNEPKKTTKAITLKGDANNYVKSVEKYFDRYENLIPQGYKEKTKLSKRTIVRSITPQGFAEAFYKANR